MCSFVSYTYWHFFRPKIVVKLKPFIIHLRIADVTLTRPSKIPPIVGPKIAYTALTPIPATAPVIPNATVFVKPKTPPIESPKNPRTPPPLRRVLSCLDSPLDFIYINLIVIQCDPQEKKLSGVMKRNTTQYYILQLASTIEKNMIVKKLSTSITPWLSIDYLRCVCKLCGRYRYKCI